MCVCTLLCCAQSCLTLCNPVDYRQPGSSIHGISQARILEQVSISFSGGSSQPRDRTHISCVFCMGRQIVYPWASRKPRICMYTCIYIHICRYYNFFHYSLLPGIEYSSLHYTVSPWCLFILYIMCASVNPILPVYPLPTSPLVTISLFSMSESPSVLSISSFVLFS